MKYKHNSSGDELDSHVKCMSGDKPDSAVKHKSGAKLGRSPEKWSADQLSGIKKPSAALGRQEDVGVEMEENIKKSDDNDIIVLE